MKAIIYEKFGNASDVLTLEEISDPAPAPGEVLVRILASGVNPSDVKMRAGSRPGITKPPFPKIIPHSDGAGIIEAVGEGVNKKRIGQRVWIWNGQWQRPFGTAAELISIPDQQAVPLPKNLSLEEGAILGIPGLTAIHAVLGFGSIENKKILISGGAGTVGRLAIQFAKFSGAFVIATAHGERSSTRARDAGADVVLDYRAENLAEQVLSETNGKLIDHIVEVEFGNNITTNTAIIKEHGRIVSYGSALNMTPELPFYPLMFKSVTISLILVYLLTDSERRLAISNLNNLLNNHSVDFDIYKTFNLRECAKAHEVVETGNRAGSVILTVN